jgi:hypothetical protein
MRTVSVVIPCFNEHEVIAKNFQTSTSEVNGDPTVHPQTEDYRGHVNPIGPRAC